VTVVKRLPVSAPSSRAWTSTLKPAQPPQRRTYIDLENTGVLINADAPKPPKAMTSRKGEVFRLLGDCLKQLPDVSTNNESQTTFNAETLDSVFPPRLMMRRQPRKRLRERRFREKSDTSAHAILGLKSARLGLSGLPRKEDGECRRLLSMYSKNKRSRRLRLSRSRSQEPHSLLV